MNLFYQPLIPEGVHYLDDDESRHCVKVLRHKEGDEIRITDGKGSFYDAVIKEADPRQCSFSINTIQAESQRDYRIHIAISPTKNADRIEWFVEKAVEIGVDEITPLETHNTERSFIKKERLEKVAISAMKQSLKATLPLINALTDFEKVISISHDAQKFIANVDGNNPNHLKYLAAARSEYIVLIGPEGDFTPDEVKSALDKGFLQTSLGKSRLRTETAGLAACQVLHFINY